MVQAIQVLRFHLLELEKVNTFRCRINVEKLSTVNTDALGVFYSTLQHLAWLPTAAPSS